MSEIGRFWMDSPCRGFREGEAVFREGEPGDVMYVVVEGELEVRVEGRILDHVGPGGIVGEMALIDNRPRSATVLALTDCQLATVDQEQFLSLVQDSPMFCIDVMRVLSDRLRRIHAVTAG